MPATAKQSDTCYIIVGCEGEKSKMLSLLATVIRHFMEACPDAHWLKAVGTEVRHAETAGAFEELPSSPRSLMQHLSVPPTLGDYDHPHQYSHNASKRVVAQVIGRSLPWIRIESGTVPLAVSVATRRPPM